MSSESWSKAQGRNSRKFQARLDKIINFLVDGTSDEAQRRIAGKNRQALLQAVFGVRVIGGGLPSSTSKWHLTVFIDTSAGSQDWLLLQ